MIHLELCTRMLNLTIRTSGICITQNPSWRTRRTKFYGGFDIQTDHLISARRPDLVTVNKKQRTCRIENIAVPANHRVKLKKSKKRDKYLDLARELKKTMEHETDGDTNCNRLHSEQSSKKW